LWIACSQLGGPMGVHRDALGGVDQQVLQCRGGGVFATNSRYNAARSLGRFLMLTIILL
jgi:hypothetical protein